MVNVGLTEKLFRRFVLKLEEPKIQENLENSASIIELSWYPKKII